MLYRKELTMIIVCLINSKISRRIYLTMRAHKMHYPSYRIMKYSSNDAGILRKVTSIVGNCAVVGSTDAYLGNNILQ